MTLYRPTYATLRASYDPRGRRDSTPAEKARRWPWLLEAEFRVRLPSWFPAPAEKISNGWVTLLPGGVLCFAKGYRWDGATIPGGMTPARFLLASMIHDGLYALLRAGLLPAAARRPADRALRHFALDQGLDQGLAWLTWIGVRLGGWWFARPPDPFAGLVWLWLLCAVGVAAALALLALLYPR